MKSLFLAASLIVSGISAEAQNVSPNAQPKPKASATQKKEMTPEQRTTRIVRMMTAKTNLSDAQAADVKNIVFEREVALATARKSMTGKEKKATIDAAKSKADEKLQTIMTPEQWKKWLSFKEEQKKRHQDKKAAAQPTTSPTNAAEQEDFY